MQGYTYSIFSLAAIVVHLIMNFDLLMGRGIVSLRETRYRGFLVGVLIYYVTDAAWGILAGLGWTSFLYVSTVFFFLGLAVFGLTWGLFVIAYLDFGKLLTRILSWAGYALLTVNVVMLTANVFNRCIFYFDENGKYLLGGQRHLLFYLLIGYNVLLAAAVLAKALRSPDSVRSRNMMVFVNCITITLAITLQVIWPLTPFTSLGCLIGNCFLHVFVIRDEQAAMHLAKLEKALERARAAEKARSMFFSIVSHDIRTPLNAILGYSELLQDGIPNPEERNEALKAIRTSGTTLLQLVNDVLDLAKMDAGKIMFRPTPLRLSQLTDDVFAAFRLTAAEKGIELINRTADVPMILLDEHRFRQILFNLIGNAVKFTEKGSVSVDASWKASILKVSVSDTGCGIPPDMVTRILDPFVQVQDPSHAPDRMGGTGLGLSICKSLVEAMNGQIVVESQLGKGSTFRICISGIAVCEEKTAAAELKPAAGGMNLPAKVLVVDDSPVNRKVLTSFLKKAGIASIGQAGDGAEALTELALAMRAGAPYDFVFSDLWMPNMNGIEFVEKVRADSRFSSLPVFALTADTEFQRDERISLFTGFLLKPLTYDKLMKVFAAQERA